MASWRNQPSQNGFGLYDRLLKRELGDRSRRSQVRGIYGDRTWIKDLDIINELGGHSGCVNALSWSKSGRLLASGSDDQHLNIHTYQSDDSSSPFTLSTSVSTGHSANIFSVKFMPHSNDNTLVTCAGDRQIRVFDLEYAGQSTTSSVASNLASASRTQGYLHQGVRYLSDGDTNARVYRSHSDRVKRIVTESSPYLFLSCSEDGEVRQWDLRQPSSAYPASRRGRAFRIDLADDEDDGVPPPLISYKRHRLDLNTISCSPSQPHYIALGGSHQFCFLHDRRMLGRDVTFERGSSAISNGSSENQDNLMGEATQCVRRFAPQRKLATAENQSGHITACKISDANPNEMVVSWSGDWIYSFDLLRSPDAIDPQDAASVNSDTASKSNRLKQTKDRKRKRTKADSTISREATVRATSKPRTKAPDDADPEQMALRVHYENGQTENIPVVGSGDDIELPTVADETSITEAEKTSHRIARTSVKIRKHIFSLETARTPTQTDPTGYAISFTSALGFARSILPEMDEIMRNWRYPVNPDELDVVYQQTLRRNRESARRFVQACGTVARLLGGKLQTAGPASSSSAQLHNFALIVPARNEKPMTSSAEQFSYDFIKAITVWLESGPGALLEAFTPGSHQSPSQPRFPIPQDATIEAVDEVLIPYLLRLAGERPIVNLDASRFEVDSNRKVFSTEQAAVLAFASAVKIPFGDLSRAVVPASSTGQGRPVSQDRTTALRFWGFKVCRGVLLNAGDGVNYSFVSHAFGGLSKTLEIDILREESALDRQLQEINPNEEEPAVSSIGLVQQHPAIEKDDAVTASTDEPSVEEGTHNPSAAVPTIEITDEDAQEDAEEDEDEEMVPVDDLAAVIAERYPRYADGSGASDSESDSPEQDSDEEDDDLGLAAGYMLFGSARSRVTARAKVGHKVPSSGHTRKYTGHCNIKTVKDVNFFGLDDEYVVSGSDDGHLFIWDKRSTQLLNILRGDGEVVNVVQGHPYEPLLAVSGIDHTIKIFSPDARARRNATLGIGVTAADETGWSSIQGGREWFGGRRPRRAAAAQSPPPPAATSEPAVPAASADSDDDAVAPGGLASCKRIAQEYQIKSQNDVSRRAGTREAFVTRSMLARIAHAIQLQRHAETTGQDEDGGEGEGEGEEGDAEDGPVVLPDECTQM